MKLWAISDLHVAHRLNRQWVEALPARPDDWLAVVGDVGETVEHLTWALTRLSRRYDRVIWTPGNHELWSMPSNGDERGVARYERLVARCRELGVSTPEDEYPIWHGEGPAAVVAPLFMLYDYSFRPDGLSVEEAIRRARSAGVESLDERFLDPYPHATRSEWCAARVEETAARLERVTSLAQLPTVLLTHFSLRRDVVRIPRIPTFELWCGTVETTDWHTRYHALAVVSGHLHVSRTTWRDGVRFEEVSLGYPREWRRRPEAPVPRLIVPPLPLPPVAPSQALRRSEV